MYRERYRYVSLRQSVSSPRACREAYMYLFIYLFFIFFARRICIYRNADVQKCRYAKYTRSQLQDARLFGPSPWNILALIV